MILVWNGVGSSIDPAIDYDSNWQLLTMVGDGLVAWKKVTGPDGNTLVPNLAEAIPTPQDGGKKHPFTLRKGILFNNGTPVHASDIKYAILRQFEIPGPAPSFYSAVVGAGVCIKTPKSCDLDRGIVVDDAAGAITVNLSTPDPDFLAKLAASFAYAVPKGTPMKDTDTKSIPKDRRARPRRGALRRSGPSLHRGTALRRADPRRECLGTAPANRPDGRRTQSDHAAVRLPVPSSVPLRDGDLPYDGATARGSPDRSSTRRVPSSTVRNRSDQGVRA